MADLFDIPNQVDASFSAQSKFWNSDADMLAASAGGQTGVLAAITVLPQGSPNMTLAVGSGTVKVAGTTAAVTSGNVTITTAHGTFDRIDLVVVNSSGVKSVTAGTAAATPVQPEVPASSVCLCQVYVPANDTAIGSTQLRGRQIIVPGASTGNIDVQTFTSSGSWTKPSGALLVEVVCIGQGGGGGSGRRGTSNASAGGAGGAGGAISRRTISAAQCSASESVTVSSAANGGAAIAVNDTNGANGTAGTTTTFGAHVTAAGGASGAGGTTASSNGGTAASVVAGTFESFAGRDGADGTTGTPAVAPPIPDPTGTGAQTFLRQAATGGGGGGGGVSTTGTVGSAGGICWNKAGGTGANGTAGGTGGQSAVGEAAPGAGGGGGGGTSTGGGRDGGAGGRYGGGGGGGSGSVNGNVSGAGGAGGSGFVLVVTYTT